MSDERVSRRSDARGPAGGAAAIAARAPGGRATPADWTQSGGGGEEGRQGRRQHLPGRRLQAGAQGLHPGLSRHQARAHEPALAGLRPAHPPGAPGQPLHLGRGRSSPPAPRSRCCGRPGSGIPSARPSSCPRSKDDAAWEGGFERGFALVKDRALTYGFVADARGRRHHQHRPGEGGAGQGAHRPARTRSGRASCSCPTCA